MNFSLCANMSGFCSGSHDINVLINCYSSIAMCYYQVIIIIIITSSSDLQPSTALANQLPSQLVSTQIKTTRPNCFKFIIALIMTSTNIV